MTFRILYVFYLIARPKLRSLSQKEDSRSLTLLFPIFVKTQHSHLIYVMFDFMLKGMIEM